ncbi:MAG: chorismate-binding protein [Acidaminococcales bacterium]|jgi:anthranilate synthase component 1|nr:chorismate-binding protein [Acidaminococcales bacterium]
MIRPTLKETRELAKGHTLVPVALEVFSDLTTSIRVLKNLSEKGGNYYLLESVATGDAWGRYSFLGCDPGLVLRGRDGKVTAERGGTKEAVAGAPLDVLAQAFARSKSPRVEWLPPFTGGFVGYFSYEFARYAEPSLLLNAQDPEGFDDFCLMKMDKVVAFDHFRQKIILIANADVSDPAKIEENYIEAVAALKDMERLVLAQPGATDIRPGECGDFTARFSREEYCAKVLCAKQYIKEGDIFQAVLSNRFSAPFAGSLLCAYRTLRTTNPSPYMVYMRFEDLEVACTSPETLVSLRGRTLHTYPLAGTRPRAESPDADSRLERELLADEKELAEHDMLVDLGRNDLGKVSAFGSVKVEEYRHIKRFSHVMHISSRVSGELAEGKTALAALCAALPAGTLSGAPKKRAMEIIDELEGLKRGLYGGALGYIAFTGNMDLCIGIRMAVHKNGKVFVQAGGGVVADSLPENEYEETRGKARAIVNALKGGREA